MTSSWFGLVMRDLGDDSALAHDEDAIAHPEHFREIRGDQDHRALPFTGEFDHQAVYFLFAPTSIP